MAISSYTDLISAVGAYLKRDDLADQYGSFISLAEAKFNRGLQCRQMEKRAYADVRLSDSEPEYIALPLDFNSMRRMRIANVTGKPVLQFITGAQMNTERQQSSNVAGQPEKYTIFGDEIELYPTPNAVTRLEMIYRANIPALSSAAPTNWLIQQAPDAYLYGVLLEAEPYMKNDARIAVWSAGLQEAIDGLNRISMNGIFGSGPLVTRTDSINP